jgi:hypothetical protein
LLADTLLGTVEGPMEKEHFGILLEHIEHNTRTAQEGFDGIS